MSTIIQAVILLCIPAMVCLALMILRSNYLLGFPSAIFWGIAGGYAYQQSTATWDIPYFVFFGAMGMVIFCLIAMPALRRRDTAGPDADKGAFIDEKGGRWRKPSKEGVSVQYADDYGETGEEDPFDIDKLPMHGIPDSALNWRSRGYSARLHDRLNRQNLALHDRAADRAARHRAKWGDLS